MPEHFYEQGDSARWRHTGESYYSRYGEHRYSGSLQRTREHFYGYLVEAPAKTETVIGHNSGSRQLLAATCARESRIVLRLPNTYKPRTSRVQAALGGV